VRLHERYLFRETAYYIFILFVPQTCLGWSLCFFWALGTYISLLVLSIYVYKAATADDSQKCRIYIWRQGTTEAQSITVHYTLLADCFATPLVLFCWLWDLFTLVGCRSETKQLRWDPREEEEFRWRRKSSADSFTPPLQPLPPACFVAKIGITTSITWHRLANIITYRTLFPHITWLQGFVACEDSGSRRLVLPIA